MIMIWKVIFWLTLSIGVCSMFIADCSVDHMFNGNEIIKIKPSVYLTPIQSLIFYGSLGAVAIIGLLMGLQLDVNLAASLMLVNLMMWVKFAPVDSFWMALTEIMLTSGFMPMLVIGALARKAADPD